MILVMRQRIANRLRLWADRLDDYGAPRLMGWSFTFEYRQGLVFNTDHRGCPVWYYGKQDYNRAWTESETMAE